MPRITAHVRQYPPARFIGAELATHELLKWLAGRGWNVTARVSESLDLERAGHVWEDYELDKVQVTNASITDLPAPDVVLHSTMGFDYARAQARMHGALRVMWLHGGWASWQVQQITKAAPDLVIYNSEDMAKGIDHLVAQPSAVLHPPVWARAGTVGQVRAPWNGGKVTLVNTTEGKGANIFYDLAAHMPMTEFLAIGGGHGQQIAPPDLPNLEYRPHGTDMAAVWSDTAVLLMPSTTESWGMAAVEAMHRGIPVIGMDVPGLRECLGWNGPDGAAREFCMPLIQMQDCIYGPGAWAAVLRNVLATWEDLSERALRRSGELDPTQELLDFEALLFEQLEHHPARRTKAGV